jgi:hypothetical protein
MKALHMVYIPFLNVFEKELNFQNKISISKNYFIDKFYQSIKHTTKLPVKC